MTIRITALSLILSHLVMSAWGSPMVTHASGAARLTLTTTVIREVSCSNRALTLHLRLTFTNVGSETIILDKRSSVIARDMVSGSLDAAAKKRYEDIGRYEDSGPTVDETESTYADPGNFILLRPGESFETESDWSRTYFTVIDGLPQARGALPYGTHFLQVEVGTWLHGSDAVAAKVKKAFQGKGVLWTTPLVSSPMPFSIEKDRPISKCK